MIQDHLRGKGWSEEKIAELVLPYLPPPGSPLAKGGPQAVQVPPYVSREWLDRHLPKMDREEISRVVEQLERRGWPPSDAAVAVLPRLLPSLPAEDAAAILSGLHEIGVPQEEIARLSGAD